MYSSKIFLFIAIILSIVFTSCERVIDRSIVEELTPKELNELTTKYKGFDFTYRMIEENRKYIKTTSEKAEWYELTYLRYHNFIQTIFDDDFRAKLNEMIKEDWDKEYGVIQREVEEIDKKYREDFNKRNLLKYVDVDVIDIKKVDPILWSAGYTMTVRITPKRCIDALKAYVTILPERLNTIHYKMHFMADNNNIIQQNTFCDPITIPVTYYTGIGSIHEVNEYFYDKEENVKISEIKDLYDIVLNINEISIDGQTMKSMDLYKDIPESIRQIWDKYIFARNIFAKSDRKYTENDYLRNIKRAAEELLGKEFITLSSYSIDRERKTRFGLDFMAARFYYLDLEELN